MRKYAETLVNYVGDKPFKHCGNHMVMNYPSIGYANYLDDKTDKWVTIDNATRSFTYHGNVICVVDDLGGKYWLSHAGWFTSSTSQALGQYKTYFSGLGYQCMTE